MKTEIICFTMQGYELGKKIADVLGHEVNVSCGSKKACEKFNLTYKNHILWTKENFDKADNLIFIGAIGIAVRSIAPYLKSKTTDPAILVLDEKGEFVIPILSGHIGGANKLANTLSQKISSTPVLTTSTDVNNIFAVDSWAVEQGLKVYNPHRIKEVSGKIVNGESIVIMSEIKISGNIPSGVIVEEYSQSGFADVKIMKEPIENSRSLVLLYNDNTNSITF